MNDIIKAVEKKHGLKVTLVKPGDEYCQANGEDHYNNWSGIGGREIELGIYENDELKLISLFHEVGHRLLPKGFWEKCRHNTLVSELECWRLGILEAEEFGVLFSDEAIKWGYEQALGYAGHDERERSDWAENTGKHLWVNKSGYREKLERQNADQIEKAVSIAMKHFELTERPEVERDNGDCVMDYCIIIKSTLSTDELVNREVEFCREWAASNDYKERIGLDIIPLEP